MAIATYLYIFGAFLISIFALQHTGRKQGWTWTPGYVIDLAATFCENLWEKIGKFLVWISSFYTVVDLKDWWITCDQVLGPTIRFIMSWTVAITTYVSEMKLYDHPYLISLGSTTLIGILSYLVYWKFGFINPYDLLIWLRTTRLVSFFISLV